jgi:hypothetical protein
MGMRKKTTMMRTTRTTWKKCELSPERKRAELTGFEKWRMREKSNIFYSEEEEEEEEEEVEVEEEEEEEDDEDEAPELVFGELPGSANEEEEEISGDEEMESERD